MVRELTEKWKQAVGYFLSSGPISAADMKVHLLECITRLKDVGLKVVVIIGDHGSNNRNLFQSLLGCTIDKPFFVYNNNKVFLLYDPPHLLKSIWNMVSPLVTHILWQHVVDFNTLDSSQSVRMAPKLTKKHIDLPAFAPLQVHLAAQVLSHSVAMGLHMMAQRDKLPEEMSYTVTLINTFDKLLNKFNSRRLSSRTYSLRNIWSLGVSGEDAAMDKICQNQRKNTPTMSQWLANGSQCLTPALGCPS
ncbi:hypothetical protein LSH36_735g00023 [Paralvinella palmiformis]|uniref:Transposase n=1 Tax=Paralvinella palmiformis TaxID=53620 RepID=A0AAD9MUM0_9ANNE|nr:hypothetical protein LSH36_735g00023 [Paralvinella palmiformis]